MKTNICNVDKHIVKVKRYITSNNENDFYEIVFEDNNDNAFNTLFKENRLDIFYLNREKPCIAMVFGNTTIEYDVDYSFDGEDEHPYETSREETTISYIPISYCPICGKQIEIEIIEEIDLSEQEKELLSTIDEIEKLSYSKRSKKKTTLLYKSYEDLRKLIRNKYKESYIDEKCINHNLVLYEEQH